MPILRLRDNVLDFLGYRRMSLLRAACDWQCEGLGFESPHLHQGFEYREGADLLSPSLFRYS